MRVIAGRFRGRRLGSPAGDRVRPTTDRLRETLFNMLTHSVGSFAGLRVADLYAGTGALGLEALSRGAAHVTFVDNHPASVALVRGNVAALGVADETRVLHADATRLRAPDAPFGLVFLDPPYGKGLVAPTMATLCAQGWVQPGSVIVVEAEADLILSVPGLTTLRDRSAGAARITILQIDGTGS